MRHDLLGAEDRPASIALHLMGALELTADGAAVPLTHAAERLLALLAIRARPMLRLYVAGTLWSGSTEQHAIGCLRSALWRLGPIRPRVVQADADHLRLAPSVRVDLHEVSARARRLVHGGGPQDGDFAALLLAEDLLPDHYDDWVLIERERYRELRSHALEALCGQLTAASRHGEAVEAGLAAVNGEPLRESAHRVLIRAHLAEGNRCEAMRQFERYQRLLHTELGLEPSADIAAMLPAQDATRQVTHA